MQQKQTSCPITHKSVGVLRYPEAQGLLVCQCPNERAERRVLAAARRSLSYFSLAPNNFTQHRNRNSDRLL
eukprot:superscaffoldBa00003420_g16887